jgi:hypothetical protein
MTVSFCTVCVRLLAILQLVLSISHVAADLPSYSSGISVGQSFVFWLSAIASSLVIAALFWFAAPLLAKGMLGVDGGNLPSFAVSSQDAFQIGVALIGLWLIPIALVSLSSIALNLVDPSLYEGIDAGARLKYSMGLKQEGVRALVQLVIESLLVLRASKIASFAQSHGIVKFGRES